MKTARTILMTMGVLWLAAAMAAAFAHAMADPVRSGVLALLCFSFCSLLGHVSTWWRKRARRRRRTSMRPHWQDDMTGGA